MTLTLKIAKNVYGGDGLARLGDGRVCFVPDAFAGETVKAELVEQKKNFVRARVVDVVEPSPDRLPAPGASVPGMVYASVSYAAELRMKEEQLGNFLGRLGLSYPRIAVTAGRSENYRNKVTYHVEKRDGRWHLGYREEPAHRVVDVESDPLACAEINAELPAIRRGVTALLTQGSRNVRRSAAAAAEENVTIRHTPIDGVKWWMGAPPAGLELTERTRGLKFRVAADGFYQVNPQVGELLVKAVEEAYLEGAAEAEHLLDLYCGVGTFGLCCLKAAAGLQGNAAPRLVGVESGRAAVADAKRNAADLGLRGSFFCERVGGSLGRLRAGRHHVVIVDPPRGGLERNVPEWLAKSSAKRIFYVSCDPATLTRDLAALVKNFRVRRVQLFDMFPRTARFETFVELENAQDASGAGRK